MISALWSAATGMSAQELNLNTVSNNIANVNTTGFKKSKVSFHDLLYQNTKTAGSPGSAGQQMPVGIQVGLGTKVVAVNKIFSQGALEQTQNTFELAIAGDGFFQVLMPTGEVAYTRDGSFRMNSDGQIVTPEGFFLQPEITIPADALSVNIGIDGTVSVLMAGQPTPSELGNIELARFINPAGLMAMGRNLFLETQASGTPVLGTPGQEGLGTVEQGFLEKSNVEVVEEMIDLIIVQRAYEANSKSVQTADELLRIATTLRR